MDAKSSTQRESFLRLLANCPGTAELLKLKVSSHQFITDLPQNATVISRFLKYVRNLGFLERKLVLCQKRIRFFFKIGKKGKFAVECFKFFYSKCFQI